MTAFGTRTSSDIFSAAKRGCRRSQDAFLAENVLLVTKVAARFLSNPNMSSERDDIIQEGMMGMHRALEKFDENRGFNFSTYAVPWIRVYVERYLQGSLIKLSMPTRTRALAWKIRGMMSHHSVEQISHKLKLDIALTVSLCELTDALPLDHVLESGGRSLEDAIVTYDEVDRLCSHFNQLPQCEKDVLLIKIGEHTGYEATSGFLDDSGMTLYQFEKTAKETLANLQSAAGRNQ